MDKVVRLSDLWKCETCFHHKYNGCDTFCDTGESYRPAYSKLPIYEVDSSLLTKDVNERKKGNNGN